MKSALTMTEAGLRVHRFPTAAAARAAGIDRETDGQPAVLVKRVCGWCKCDLGVAIGSPGQEKAISHGMCSSCQARLLAELPGVSCAVSSATAGRDRHSLVRGECLESGGPQGCGVAAADAGSPAPSFSFGKNDSAAASVTTRVTRTAGSAGVMIQPQADEHARARPAESSLFARLDRWIKSRLCGRRIEE